jgi:predicted Zn finger-like uncharacterized protein
MKTAKTIERVGFQKWYERELIQSHLHLVLLLLCAIGLLAGAELYTTQRSWSDQLVALLCAVVSAGIGVWALRRYLYLLSHAEHVANQAVCPECKTYARWKLTGHDEGTQRLQVRCRQCSHEWEIGL